MRWIACVVFVSAMGVGGYLPADSSDSTSECPEAKLKAVNEKVAALLGNWENAAQALAALPPDERARLDAELCSVAASCPIGSRAMKTFDFTNQALGASVQIEQACAAACSKKEEGGSCAKLAATVKARRQLITSLSMLAGYVASPSPDGTKKNVALVSVKPFCSQKAEKIALAVRAESCDKAAAKLLASEIKGLSCQKKTAALVASIRAAGCEKSAAKLVVDAAAPSCAKKNIALASVKPSCAEACGAGSCGGPAACAASGGGSVACASTLTAGARALQVSWAGAGPEYAALTSVERSALADRVNQLTAGSPAMQLMPPTLLALTSGLEALVALDAKLVQATDANPEILKDIPEATIANFKAQVALHRETAEVLTRARDAFLAAAASAKK